MFYLIISIRQILDQNEPIDFDCLLESPTFEVYRLIHNKYLMTNVYKRKYKRISSSVVFGEPTHPKNVNLKIILREKIFILQLFKWFNSLNRVKYTWLRDINCYYCNKIGTNLFLLCLRVQITFIQAKHEDYYKSETHPYFKYGKLYNV